AADRRLQSDAELQVRGTRLWRSSRANGRHRSAEPHALSGYHVMAPGRPPGSRRQDKHGRLARGARAAARPRARRVRRHAAAAAQGAAARAKVPPETGEPGVAAAADYQPKQEGVSRSAVGLVSTGGTIVRPRHPFAAGASAARSLQPALRPDVDRSERTR